MKRILILVFLFTAVVAVAANTPPVKKQYQPSERIPADTAVSFPVDI
jgi:hypothetical protein